MRLDLGGGGGGEGGSPFFFHRCSWKKYGHRVPRIRATLTFVHVESEKFPPSIVIHVSLSILTFRTCLEFLVKRVPLSSSSSKCTILRHGYSLPCDQLFSRRRCCCWLRVIIIVITFLRRLRLAEALRFSSGVSSNQLAFREIVIVMAKVYIYIYIHLN